LLFAFASFITGVLLTILVRTTWITVRQIGDMKTKTRLQKLEEQQAKAARLQTKPGSAVASPSGAFETTEPPVKNG
jgi:hypothetical protein